MSAFTARLRYTIFGIGYVKYYIAEHYWFNLLLNIITFQVIHRMPGGA